MPIARVTLFVIICTVLIGTALGNYGGHDLFTSLGQLNELWKNEKEVVKDMEEAIERLGEIKESLEK